ncbi:MAG: VWA domain-containing protein, partial [Planctomycetota bacterium]
DSRHARQVYEDIVRRRRDPALLEYAGHGVLRLRVFPVPANGAQEVEVRYRMLLPDSGGLYRWTFPARAIQEGSFSIRMTVTSSKPLGNLWSPLDGFEVRKKSDREASGGFECNGRPAKDPQVFYGLTERDFGLNLLTYRPQGADEGYFLLMLAPRRDLRHERQLRKDIVFVIDTSGSMQGDKIRQAQGALRYFVKSLEEGDRFNIIAFATDTRPLSNAMLRVGDASRTKAMDYIAALEARGGTNIDQALAQGLGALEGKDLGDSWLGRAGAGEEICDKEGSGAERVPMVVFLTDGLPTVGNTDVDHLLKSYGKPARDARIFAFGVGHDVNTRLLDGLAVTSRGERDYVAPNEDIEVKTSALFEKLAHPVMTDIRLQAEGVQWSRTSPNQLPDLFRGGRLVLAGRYRGSASTAVVLEGRVGDERQRHVYDASFPEKATEHDFVATIWAQRRVAFLMDQIRLNGEQAELVAEVRRIGKRHGIVTPYTSGLVLEEGQQLAQGMPTGLRRRFAEVGGELADRAEELVRAGDLEEQDADGYLKKAEEEKRKAADDARQGGAKVDLPQAESGREAVEASKEAVVLSLADKLDGRRSSRLATARRLHGKVFHLIDGVWVDRAFDKAMGAKVREVEAFSDEWFELGRRHEGAGPWLAFSTSMLIVLGDEVVLVRTGLATQKD